MHYTITGITVPQVLSSPLSSSWLHSVPLLKSGGEDLQDNPKTFSYTVRLNRQIFHFILYVSRQSQLDAWVRTVCVSVCLSLSFSCTILFTVLVSVGAVETASWARVILGGLPSPSQQRLRQEFGHGARDSSSTLHERHL